MELLGGAFAETATGSASSVKFKPFSPDPIPSLAVICRLAGLSVSTSFRALQISFTHLQIIVCHAFAETAAGSAVCSSRKILGQHPATG